MNEDDQTTFSSNVCRQIWHPKLVRSFLKDIGLFRIGDTLHRHIDEKSTGIQEAVLDLFQSLSILYQHKEAPLEKEVIFSILIIENLMVVQG